MVKIKKNQIVTTLFVFLQGLSTYTAYAGGSMDKPPLAGEAKLQTWFGGAIGGLYSLLLPIAILYGILQIIIAGYRIMASGGEPKSLSDAKEHLTGSIIGIIFVILGVVILRIIIKSFLGQDV